MTQTDPRYIERDLAREHYLSWLSRCLAALRDRPTPSLEPKERITLTERKKSILENL